LQSRPVTANQNSKHFLINKNKQLWLNKMAWKKLPGTAGGMTYYKSKDFLFRNDFFKSK
jgi:hypothetical protein